MTWPTLVRKPKFGSQVATSTSDCDIGLQSQQQHDHHYQQQRQHPNQKDGRIFNGTTVSQHHQNHRDGLVSATATAPVTRGRTRLIFWLVAIGLVILQLMVANIIYLHPSEQSQRHEEYPIIPYFDNSLTSANQQERRRAASIVISQRNQQRRKQKRINATTSISANTKALRKNTYNFAEQVNLRSHIDAAKAGIYYHGMDDVLYPIMKVGKMYSICRGDRSGSVIADMIYAHAYAYAHNITYIGNCCVTRGLPKEDTKNLIHSLHWHTIIPFKCPKGVNNKIYNLSKPNATSIHRLLVNPDVYRLQGNRSAFTPAWRRSIHKALYKYEDHHKDRPYHIAVHVRRGDVTPCTYKRRYLPNSHYLALIDQYTPNATTLNGRPLQVTIYSESNTFEPFDAFTERNYNLEIDTEHLAHVWSALSTADVAILSRSYFSIVPAAINPNIVVATEFFEFDVHVMDGWEFADPSLVESSDEIIRQMFLSQCNNTKKLVGSKRNVNNQIAAD